MITRRGLIRNLTLLIAAPAIVRVASLMPVKAWMEPDHFIPIYGSIYRPTNPWWISQQPLMIDGVPIYSDRLSFVKLMSSVCTPERGSIGIMRDGQIVDIMDVD